MRHNRKKNRSIFFLTFSSCVFCFSVFSFCCSSALALRSVCVGISSFFFFYLKGGGWWVSFQNGKWGLQSTLPATVRPTGLRGIAESVFCQHVKPL